MSTLFKRKPVHIMLHDPMRPSLVDEVHRLFAIYRDRFNGAEPMAGGTQNLIRLAQQVCEPVDLFERRKKRLVELPNTVLFSILSYLDNEDLCNLALTCRRCCELSNSDYIWKKLLARSEKTWFRVLSNRNPDQYTSYTKLVGINMTFKEIYLRCKPRRDVARFNDNVLSRLSTFVGLNSCRVVMFGPGLETETSSIVRHILNDEHTGGATLRFKVSGMIPGAVVGMGSGIKLRLNEFSLDLITLYGNVRSIRRNLNEQDRLQQNKLFVTAQGDVVELSPQVRDLCKTADAFVFVIDSQTSEENISSYISELSAMLCNMWSHESAPLTVLLLSNDKTKNTKPSAPEPVMGISPIEVARALRLGRMKRKWMVQTGNANTLLGVREAFRWTAAHASSPFEK